MDAETLSDPRVEEAITERFVPLHLDLHRDRSLVRRYRLFWTPTLYFLDMSGNAHAESVGFLPPDEMLPLLDYGDAQVSLRRGRFQQAADRLVGLAQTYPDSGFAPDALYWAAIAEYMTTGDNARLNERRAELERRFPGSLAAKKV